MKNAGTNILNPCILLSFKILYASFYNLTPILCDEPRLSEMLLYIAQPVQGLLW